MKIKFLKDAASYTVGEIATFNCNDIDVIRLTIPQLVEYGLAEVIEEKEYTRKDLLEFASYAYFVKMQEHTKAMPLETVFELWKNGAREI